MWVHIGTETIWESSSVRFSGMTIDSDLKFEIHSSELRKKTSRKISTVSRIGKYLKVLKKQKLIFKALIEL